MLYVCFNIFIKCLIFVYNLNSVLYRENMYFYKSIKNKKPLRMKKGFPDTDWSCEMDPLMRYNNRDIVVISLCQAIISCNLA